MAENPESGDKGKFRRDRCREVRYACHYLPLGFSGPDSPESRLRPSEFISKTGIALLSCLSWFLESLRC